MKKLIGCALLGLCIFVCMPSSKVEAAKLDLSNENYCKYVFGASDWDCDLIFIVSSSGGTTKMVCEYNTGHQLTVTDQLAKYKDHNIASGITVNSDGKVTGCPVLCMDKPSYGDMYVDVHKLATSDAQTKILAQDSSLKFKKDGCLSNIGYKVSERADVHNNRTGGGNSSGGDTVDSSCKGMIGKEQEDFIRTIISYIQILAPLLLIIMCATDCVRAVMASDEKKMKEAYVRTAKRIVAAICIFLIPIFVRILFKIPGINDALKKSGIVDDPLCYDSK